eukprot:EG_transcript_20031
MVPNPSRDVPYGEWVKLLERVRVSKQSLNQLVMNYLVVEGYKDSAEQFQQESGTDPGIDLDSVTDRMAVRSAIQEGSVLEAISRVNDLNPDLLEMNTDLHFQVKKQEFIELVRKGDIPGALRFAEEELAPTGELHPALLEELEDVMALLAFPDPAQSPLRHLLDVAHRQKTASELNAAILAAQCQEKEPKLLMLLRLLTWAQAKLDETTQYPRIGDLATAAWKPP